MLVDPCTNAPLIGFNYDATPEEVLDYFGLIEHPPAEGEKVNAADAEADRGKGEMSPDDDEWDPY
jgi:hypothetical protein